GSSRAPISWWPRRPSCAARRRRACGSRAAGRRACCPSPASATPCRGSWPCASACCARPCAATPPRCSSPTAGARTPSSWRGSRRTRAGSRRCPRPPATTWRNAPRACGRAARSSRPGGPGRWCAPPAPPPPAAGPAAVSFPVGERLVYQARYGPFNVGTATLEVAGIDTLRGIETVHFVFRIEGGALWYHLNQRLESWVGRADFESRRYWNQTEEKGRSWERKFDIYPDSGFYREAGPDSAAATVPAPLDDAAFLYWIRTVPLEPGQRY